MFPFQDTAKQTKSLCEQTNQCSFIHDPVSMLEKSTSKYTLTLAILEMLISKSKYSKKETLEIQLAPRLILQSGQEP